MSSVDRPDREPPGAFPPIAEADPEALASAFSWFSEENLRELSAEDPRVEWLVRAFRERVAKQRTKESQRSAGRTSRKKGEKVGLPDEDLAKLVPRG